LSAGTSVITVNQVATTTVAAGNASITITVTAVPVQAEQWVLKWTSPAGDVRNTTYWNSYLTWDVNGNSENPVGAPLISITSVDGLYKVEGNYWQNASSDTKYAACTLGSGLLPYVSDQTIPVPGGNTFYSGYFVVWHIYHKELA
jgi:hypothetical protein